MKLNDFQYHLPEELIAQHPLHRRDQARLMVVDRARQMISHDVFANIARYLPEQSCLVLNDSKVVPARLLGKREGTGGRVEIFLLKKLADGYSYETLLKPLRRLKVDEKIIFNGGSLVATIKDKEKRIICFNRKNITAQLEKIGHIPLPPYIKRLDRVEDRKYYQTVYAQRSGSVASPTAGLHFTNRLLNSIQKKGHAVERVTLHINYATFKPVEVEDITQHKMHVEEYLVAQKTMNALRQVRARGRKVVAVGTTSCRVLESVAAGRPLKGCTDIFMYPGYRFGMIDVLITNFHLPASTLLMLVYAFGGIDLMRRAYAEAIQKKYRFFSYGDAMIIV